MANIEYLNLDNYSKILPLIKSWKESEYKDLFWNTDNKSVITLMKSAEFKYSSINRERMYYLMGNMNLDRVDTLTTIVSIEDDSGKSILCGFVYSNVSIDNKDFVGDVDKDPQWLLYSANILTKYLNIGPSLESVDGEYRSGVCDWLGLYKLQQYYQSVYESVIGYLKRKNGSRKYKLRRETFFPTARLKSYEADLDRHFAKFEIPLNMYMMVWYIGIYNKLTNIREDHVNERYIAFIDKYGDEDVEFFKSLIVSHGKETIEIIYRYLQNLSISGKYATTVLGMGQKLTPLNLLEAQNPFDVRFVPWRDYLVSQALSKLVINNICPGFALMNSWAYVKSSKKGLFNNKIQYQKIERSDQARAIIDLLVKSKSYTYQNIKDGSIKKTKGTVTEMLSDKFKILHDQIDDAVNFGKNEIIMSNVSLLTFGEFTGRTWSDSVRLVKSSPYYNETLGKPYTSEGHKYFKKYMFDVCYNLYCMFEKFGVIHGDLHLNNLTLYQKFAINYADFDKIENPHVAYLVGEEGTKNEYCFVMPSLAYNVSIIDFGRAFIHPQKLETIRDTSVPKRYALTGDMALFIKEQTRRLVRAYITAVPSAAEQENDIKLLFTRNFDVMYKLMSVLDLYTFLSKLNALFLLGKKDVVSPHANCTYLIQKLIDVCGTYLISDVSKLIEDKSYVDVVESNRTPLLEIMLKVFADDLYSPDQAAPTMIDLFIYNNPLAYSLTSLNEMPDLYKINKYMKNGALQQISSTGMDVKCAMRLAHEKKANVDMDMVDLIVRRHKEKLF
jgi:hypothetical protein